MPNSLLCVLGVCAAESFEDEGEDFDLSESRRSDYFDGTQGSRTPEIASFCSIELLPRRLLGQFNARTDRFVKPRDRGLRRHGNLTGVSSLCRLTA